MQPRNEPVPAPGPALGFGLGTANATGGVTANTANNLPVNGLLFQPISRITGTYTTDEIYNPGARGVRLNLVIAPTGPATGTWDIRVEVPSPVASGTGYIWKPLFGTVATGCTGNGTGALTGALYTIYPGLTGIADAVATNGPGTVNQHLGPRWRAKVVTTLDTLTFSLGADYLI